MTNADTIEGRLRRVRGNVSRNKFGQLIDRVGRTVERWEKNFSGTDADLLMISEKTGVRFEWLKTAEGTMRAEPVPATGQVSEDLSPVDQSSSATTDLEETGRTTYLKVVGPGGQVMAQIDLVF